MVKKDEYLKSVSNVLASLNFKVLEVATPHKPLIKICVSHKSLNIHYYINFHIHELIETPLNVLVRETVNSVIHNFVRDYEIIDNH